MVKKWYQFKLDFCFVSKSRISKDSTYCACLKDFTEGDSRKSPKKSFGFFFFKFRAIKNVSELLTARNSNYNFRGDAILKLPKVNSTKYGIKSWRYRAARLWNTIPNNLRNMDTYRSFKRGLKELDLVGL